VEEVAAGAPDHVLPDQATPWTDGTPRIVATAPPPERIKLDKGGYFVISIQGSTIAVEHYDYKEYLLHVIEGNDARTICWTLINSGWITQLDHAAYLGRELARAEFSVKHGVGFEQEGA
jgi:tetrahydromethanopterin S-methyltransferase subunit A